MLGTPGDYKAAFRGHIGQHSETKCNHGLLQLQPNSLSFICDLCPPWTRPATDLLPSDTEKAGTDIHAKEGHPPHCTHVSTKTKNRNQNIFSCFWKIAFFVIEKYFHAVLSFSLVMDVPRNQCLKQPASSNLLNHFGVAKTVLCLPIDPSPFAWERYYVTTHPKRAGLKDRRFSFFLFCLMNKLCKTKPGWLPAWLLFLGLVEEGTLISLSRTYSISLKNLDAGSRKRNIELGVKVGTIALTHH